MTNSVPIVGGARGRGAKSNHSSRFLADQREDFDDGWTEHDPQPPKLTTTVSPMKSKTIIARNTSPDISFDRSINPYRGCETGCIYKTDTHASCWAAAGLSLRRLCSLRTRPLEGLAHAQNAASQIRWRPVHKRPPKAERERRPIVHHGHEFMSNLAKKGRGIGSSFAARVGREGVVYRVDKSPNFIGQTLIHHSIVPEQRFEAQSEAKP